MRESTAHLGEGIFSVLEVLFSQDTKVHHSAIGMFRQTELHDTILRECQIQYVDA